MRNGATVAAFEREFASFVGAKYAIALCNGTATLHTALVALGVQPGDRVAVPPLTMASTTIAVLHAGAVPVFHDVGERRWLMRGDRLDEAKWAMPVSLYGLHYRAPSWATWAKSCMVDDAAQTLRPHGDAAFTSYSFQASKILALGEGGMLVTNDGELATRAREFSSLGYRMRADQPRIDPDALKSPTFDRHYSLGWNYRMADCVAAEGLKQLELVDDLLTERASSAQLYERAHAGCDWLTPQHVPDGWTHDYWTYAVACDTPVRANALADEIVHQGGERPYPAWRLTHDEPAFRHLVGQNGPVDVLLPCRGICPAAESLQPRLLQFQTNHLPSAERDAAALRRAIEVLS